MLVLVVIVLIVGAASVNSLLGPRQADEFAASSPGCVEVSETQALFAVTIEPINPGRVMSVHVEELGIRGGELTGVATLPVGTSLDTVTETERPSMEADLDDAQTWIDTSDETRVVVMRVEKTPGFDVTVTGVNLWFAYGEPAGVQQLPMNLSWGDDCTRGQPRTNPWDVSPSVNPASRHRAASTP